jgi:glycosyltransferase involved in cell wall biosynthesis
VESLSSRLGRLRVGILSPTTWTLVEKMAALFPQGIEVAGPLSDDKHYWNNYCRKTDEWKELGLRVSLNLGPYRDVDFSKYDVLIQSAETFHYAKDWTNHCHRIECPILVKACWTREPLALMPAHYVKKVRDFPVLLEMPSHADLWRAAGFTDVNVIFNPVGDWWFSKQWTGREERVLFVLSGTRSWRGKSSSYVPNLGIDIWDRLCREFPGKTCHHDGHESYKRSIEMTDLFAESRVFVNLDRPYGQGERPLTVAFTEALSAGLPVVARDLPGLNYRDYIDSNGVCTDDFDTMRSFIGNCLQDIDFARTCSRRSREIGRRSFSCEALKPKYDRIISRAQEIFLKAK